VNINYPFGKQKKVFKNDVAHIVKYFAIGLENIASKTIMKNAELSAIMTDIIFKQIDNECQGICMKESNSVLRSTDPSCLIQFKMENVKSEISEKAPTFSSLLQKICTSKRSKHERETRIHEIVVPTIASIILHSRSPEMSAFSYRLGLILRHAGAGTLVRAFAKILYLSNPLHKKTHPL
jgi:hypothetical protein